MHGCVECLSITPRYLVSPSPGLNQRGTNTSSLLPVAGGLRYPQLLVRIQTAPYLPVVCLLWLEDLCSDRPRLIAEPLARSCLDLETETLTGCRINFIVVDPLDCDLRPGHRRKKKT